MKIEKHGRRFWRVFDEDGSLVAVTAYLKGAREVVRRLSVACGRTTVHEDAGPYPRPERADPKTDPETPGSESDEKGDR